MLTKAFNCFNCREPFDCQQGQPKGPFYSLLRKMVWCRICAPNVANLPQRGLMDFLNQPAFKKTEDGYEYTAPFNDPICFGCEQHINVMKGCSAFPVQCGHFLCGGCNALRNNRTYNSCKNCRVMTDDPGDYFAADSSLATFSREIGENELKRKLDVEQKENEMLRAVKARIDAIEAKKTEDRKNGALKRCWTCDIEQSLERLYKCNDCLSINCGNCFFDSHQGHDVVKLLGIELDKMEGQHGQRYTETLEGLRGNVQYVQKNIDNAMDKVLNAGRQRLAKIKECTQYQRASMIAEKVEKAAEDFEKECEVYFAVARKFATRLEELEEELMKEEE